MPKFPWQKVEKEGSEEFTLPDDLNKKIEDGAKAAAELPKITEMLNGLKSIMETDAAARKKEKDDASAAAFAAARSKTKEETDAEIEDLILTDPKKAIELATRSSNIAILTLNAQNVQREVFEDAEKFEYYHGDIKAEVNKMIAAQPLSARQDYSMIENCYHTVVGKHTKEIAEGKLKTRFAGSENGSRGTSSGAAGSSSSEGSKVKPELTDEIRRAARQVGIKAEDYAEMLQNEGVI
jgi:stress response protein SCP2